MSCRLTPSAADGLTVGQMPPLTVVEQLAMLRNLVASLLTGLIVPVMRQLILQRPL